MKRYRAIPRDGFSLVELLVAIGVVAGLALLLFPVQRSITERSRQITCLNQLKELFTVMTHYAADHQQGLPKSYTSTPYWTNWWNGPLTRYCPGGAETLARLAVCPLNRTPAVVPASGIKGYPYVVNYNVIRPTAANNPDANPPTRLARIPRPSDIVLLLDSKNDSDWYIGFYDKTAPNGWGRVAAPHLKQTNILWADGHVSSSPLEQISVNQLQLVP